MSRLNRPLQRIPTIMAPPEDKPIRDVAAAIVQNNEGRVLLLQRSPTAPTFPLHWGPVTGMVVDDETPAEAALREIAEELGVRPDTGGRIVRAAESFTVDIGEIVLRVHPFLCALDETATIVLNRENTRYAWLTVAEALALPTIPNLEVDFQLLGLL